MKGQFDLLAPVSSGQEGVVPQWGGGGGGGVQLEAAGSCLPLASARAAQHL